MRRPDLERALGQVPLPPHPTPDLEQVRTPPAIAAELLWKAQAERAIEGRRVLDLGCGTGIFALGAALLGARLATGVEVDADAVALAQQAARDLRVANRTWFVAADLATWRPEPAAFDTVVMNPPFGAQRGNRHGDRLFYARAAEALRGTGGTCWFLAQENSERFLDAYARELDAEVEKVASWDYPLEAAQAFHRKGVQAVPVGGYRMAFRPAGARG
ncbi:MAG TPA: methyltransferase [Candidatus Thermoplasmatota archaeon]|nr:methyltransferase [Candidatus Thermoplasmatota archaeon]